MYIVQSAHTFQSIDHQPIHNMCVCVLLELATTVCDPERYPIESSVISHTTSSVSSYSISRAQSSQEGLPAGVAWEDILPRGGLVAKTVKYSFTHKKEKISFQLNVSLSYF